MHKGVSFLTGLAIAGCLLTNAGTARADDNGSACRDVPSHAALRAALEAARAQANGGFNLEMWATVVNRDGVVCAVAFTGNERGDQWPGSRVISAQKANTANAFSLPVSRSPRRTSTPRRSRAAACSGCRRAIQSTPASRTAATRRTTAKPTIRWSAAESAA